MGNNENDSERVNLGGGECPPGWEALNVTRIDFSEAHFLDHSVWECLRDGDSRANRFGGVRQHLDYAWEFKWRPALRTATLCRINRHRPVKAWWRDRDPQDLVSCGDCCKDLGDRHDAG